MNPAIIAAIISAIGGVAAAAANRKGGELNRQPATMTPTVDATNLLAQVGESESTSEAPTFIPSATTAPQMQPTPAPEIPGGEPGTAPEVGSTRATTLGPADTARTAPPEDSTMTTDPLAAEREAARRQQIYETAAETGLTIAEAMQPIKTPIGGIVGRGSFESIGSTMPTSKQMLAVYLRRMLGG